MLHSHSWTYISLNTACNKLDTTVLRRMVLLWNIWGKSIARWACSPSKALVTKDMSWTKNVDWVQSMIDKSNQQKVGCFSSGQWRKSHLSVRMSCCTFLDFHQKSGSAVRACSLLKRMMSWHTSNRSPSRTRCLEAPDQILSHWPQRLPFSWRVT